MTTEFDQAKVAHALSAIFDVVNSETAFSDLLIVADEPIMLRNASGWFPFKAAPYTKDDIEYIISTMEPNWEAILPKGGFSRPFLLRPWRLRITAGLASRGTKQVLSIRRTPITPIPLQKTGLPPQIRLMVDNPKGIVLLSGATGAGKTTTLAALVDCINSSRNAHIVTIEDPIEYEFVPNKSIFTQQEVGVDTPSFSDAVRGAMRQRPDVIVIGEIRDRDTAENAILAGESGHLVIATLHASSCYGAIQKLVQFFPGEEDTKLAALSSSLMGVVNQSIIPGMDKANGVVATELFFNHHQQFSGVLSDARQVNSIIDLATDGVCRSMAASLADLVQAKRITKGDAFRSVAGQGTVFKQLEERLASAGNP